MSDSIKQYYKSFSGSDAIIFALFPEAKALTLGSVTTLSYAIYREKKPMVLLGRINVDGYVSGPRFIAGTMVVKVIGKSFVNRIIEEIDYLKGYGPIKTDELPLFDLLIIVGTEYGYTNKMKLYGCTMGDESQVIDSNQMVTTIKFTFAARDIDTFGYEDSMANYNVTQNIIFKNEGSVLVNQNFETKNYLTDYEVPKIEEVKEEIKLSIKEFIQKHNPNANCELTTADEHQIKLNKEKWHDTNLQQEEELLNYYDSLAIKEGIHHDTEMIRGTACMFGGEEGSLELSFIDVKIKVSKANIYSDINLTSVAKTLVYDDTTPIIFVDKSRGISYIKTGSDYNYTVTYIKNSDFIIV